MVARGGGLILPGDDDFPEEELAKAQPRPAAGRPPGVVSDRPQIGGFRPPPSNGFAPVETRQTDGPLYQPFRMPAAFAVTAALSREDLMRRVRGAFPRCMAHGNLQQLARQMRPFCVVLLLNLGCAR